MLSYGLFHDFGIFANLRSKQRVSTSILPDIYNSWPRSAKVSTPRALSIYLTAVLLTASEILLHCYSSTAAAKLNLHTSVWSLVVSTNLREFHSARTALSTCYSGHHASCHLLHLRQRLRHPQHRHPPPQLRQEVGDRAGGWPCRDTTVPTVSKMIRLAICIPPNASKHLQNSKCI